MAGRDLLSYSRFVVGAPRIPSLSDTVRAVMSGDGQSAPGASFAGCAGGLRLNNPQLRDFEDIYLVRC